ncbi:hypothetical protein O181_070510 [Austropuccinia psidii MF-1]|uniref:Tf2-1-like SH3-like domain-containing protein n=1 Tax=Austropuccinia psidii MF-1 TaxID=1389203 RepID=A0A9Q3F4Y5_9BASI|nr:hypothetical protein [Austropuccinia psidii MF-1]
MVYGCHACALVLSHRLTDTSLLFWINIISTCGVFKIIFSDRDQKQRYDKTHMELDLKEGDQVLVSTLQFHNLKGPKKVRDSFVGPFTIIRLIGKNAMKVRITEEFSRKHPVFPVSLVKPYFQTGEDEFPSRNKIHTPKDIVEVED